jgi:hypothetical protein
VQPRARAPPGDAAALRAPCGPEGTGACSSGALLARARYTPGASDVGSSAASAAGGGELRGGGASGEGRAVGMREGSGAISEGWGGGRGGGDGGGGRDAVRARAGKVSDGVNDPFGRKRY